MLKKGNIPESVYVCNSKGHLFISKCHMSMSHCEHVVLCCVPLCMCGG